MPSVIPVLLNSILPVFAILAVGFALGRAGWTSLDDARIANRLAMTIFIPMLVFSLVANAPFAAFPALAMALYALVQWSLFAAVYAGLRRTFAVPQGEAVILAFSGIFANNVFYGYPIARLIDPVGDLLPMTTVVVLDSTLSFGGIMLLLQVIERGTVRPRALASILVRTPVLAAIVAGGVMAASGLNLPGPVQTFLEFNGRAAAPLALFALGVVLSSTRFTPDPVVAGITLIKLLLFPALIWAVVTQVSGPPEAPRAFAFAAAGPTGTIVFSMALLHGIDTARVTQIMVWTSLLTLVTLAALA